MADINALIAQGGVPFQVRSPVEQESRLIALQNAQQQQQLNALRMAAYQRGVEEQNALRRSLQESYNPETGEYDLTRARTLGGQYGADPMALQQFASQQETAAVQRENTAAQRAQREQTTEANRRNMIGSALMAAMRDSSDDNLTLINNTLQSSGINASKEISYLLGLPPEQRITALESLVRTSADARAILNEAAKAAAPKVVAPGGSVFDPRTGRFATAPEASPAVIREMQALGYPITAEGFAAYQSAKGRAAPGTTVNVGLQQQGRAFETELGKGQAERILKSQAAATDAASIIDTVNTGRQIMKSGMITGAGAEFFVNLNQALKTAGIDAGYSDASANSQAFAANMASNVGRVIKQFGAGTGLSNADREYAEKMAGGKITLDAAAINRILDINERAARNVIKEHNKNVKDIKTNIPLTVEEPPEIRAGLSAQDKEALDWANANPKDRRAAEIKKRLGM